MNTLSSLLAFIASFEPVGSIKMYAGASAPSKWLFCRGQNVSRTTYKKLFDVIGTTYGAGDGVSTFTLPDFRNRMPIGAGNLYALNASGGSKDAIVPYHNHSVSKVTGGASSAGSHSHYYQTQYYLVQSGATVGYNGNAIAGGNAQSGSLSVHNGIPKQTTESGGAHSHDVTAHNTNYAGTSGNLTNANLPPYRGINFIIFAGK